MAHESVPPPLRRLADGTVKQINPFTGTQVWTVPGRGNRPLAPASGPHNRIDPAQHGRHCAFCERRYLDATPEKERLVRLDGRWHTLQNIGVEQLEETVAEFRLIPNLFEIVSLDYWQLNQGYQTPDTVIERRRRYVSTPAGRAHVDALLAIRARSAGTASGDDWDDAADGLFGGFHDVVVARRHFVDGAHCEDELASSGTLPVEEHRKYIEFTVRAIERMYAANARIRNVAAFQNWLRPAGASFDHLHKQIVGLDTLGRRSELEVACLRRDPEAFRCNGINLAEKHDLLVAENDHAVAFAGVGHRYPALEVWMRDGERRPWELTGDQLDAWADLLHACHVAAGSLVPCNEEWHYRPPGVEGRMPLRAVLKWRISTLAGFEGGTDININTIDPWSVRDRARAALAPLEGTHALADRLRLAR